MKLSWSKLRHHLRRTRRARGTSAAVLRAQQRGVTLIEILIVLAIIGLIAGGVAMTAIPKLGEAQVQTTKQSAQQIRNAAQLWRTTGGSDCPTVDTLKRDKQLDNSSKLADAWDQPFKILCDDDETTVVSSGKDKKEGTADDIRVPASEQPTK